MSSSTSAAAAEFARRRQSPVQRLQSLLHSYPWLSPLILFVITFAVFSILNPRFAQPGGVSILSSSRSAIVACLGIGQTLIILTAGIDLSVGRHHHPRDDDHGDSLAADGGMNGLLALLIGIAMAVAAGFLNGILVTRVNLPPFIVTLGTLSIFTAIALLYSGGSSIQQQPAARHPQLPG